MDKEPCLLCFLKPVNTNAQWIFFNVLLCRAALPFLAITPLRFLKKRFSCGKDLPKPARFGLCSQAVAYWFMDISGKIDISEKGA